MTDSDEDIKEHVTNAVRDIRIEREIGKHSIITEKT